MRTVNEESRKELYKDILTLVSKSGPITTSGIALELEMSYDKAVSLLRELVKSKLLSVVKACVNNHSHNFYILPEDSALKAAVAKIHKSRNN